MATSTKYRIIKVEKPGYDPTYHIEHKFLFLWKTSSLLMAVSPLNAWGLTLRRSIPFMNTLEEAKNILDKYFVNTLEIKYKGHYISRKLKGGDTWKDVFMITSIYDSSKYDVTYKYAYSLEECKLIIDEHLNKSKITVVG